MISDEEAITLFSFATDGAPGMGRLSDRATDHLRMLIVSLQLEPGAVLDDSALVTRLSCGSTPLREAIQRLSGEHLIRILPRRAIAVAPITVTDLQQIYEVRLATESMAARLAASRTDTAQVAALEEHVTALLDDSVRTNSLTVVRHDFLFHYQLARMASNSYLCDSIQRILGPAMRLTYFAYKHGEPSTEARLEHAAILQALLAHDASAAEHEMRRHLTVAKERTLRQILSWRAEEVSS